MAADNDWRNYRANTPPADRPASAASRGGAGDPLAELARLIGQIDPFGDPTRAPRSVDGAARPLAQGRDSGPETPDERPLFRGIPYAGDERHVRRDPMPASSHPPDLYQADALRPAGEGPHVPLAPESGYDRMAHPSPDQGSAGYGAQGAEPYEREVGGSAAHGQEDQDQDAQDFPYERPPRRRGGLVTVAAVLGLAVVGTAGAYAYRTVFGAGAASPPPLIKADSAPSKIVPATSSEAASSKQIYDRLVGEREQNEKVVPREEKPVDIKASAPRTLQPGAGAAGLSGAPAAGTAWPQPPGTAPFTSQPGPAASPTEPRKVRTVPIRSDLANGNPPTGAASSRAVPPAGESVAPPPPTPGRQQARSAAPAAPAGPAPISLAPQGGAAEPPARTAALAAPSRAAPSVAQFVVQLSAQRTQEDASAAFRAAQAKYPDILGGRQMLIRKKDLGNKGTFYGAQVGPFAAREGAVELCEQLKAAGGSCLVQRY